MTGAFACQICGAKSLSVIDAYHALPRVTSDCKPWPGGGTMTVCESCAAVQKLPDDKWRAEIEEIYGHYQIYNLSDGKEQVIFDGVGRAAPRSRTLVDFVLANAALSASGRLIDIGCGNGGALANFSAALPNWSLYGSELSQPALPPMVNFAELYVTKQIADIPGKFDLVAMIHALEHMQNPYQALRDAKNLLNEDGTIFIEVPNVQTSPFDLVVADHLMHFSPTHLEQLAAKAGLAVATVRDNILPKEITLLAGNGNGASRPLSKPSTASAIHGTIDWLRRLMAQAQGEVRRGGSIGIFGTSISGMWLYGAVASAVSFFVDEDVTRIGGSYDGRPIVAPSDIPPGATVLLPFAPQTAGNIIGRHGGAKANWVVPPPIEA